MDQPGMALTGVAGRVDDARHLDAQGEVLAETVADARRHRDAAGGGFLLQESVVGRVDPAVDQSSESAHRSPPKRCRNRAANAEHLRNRVFRELARDGSAFRDRWSSTLSCAKTRCLLTVSIPRLLRGSIPTPHSGLTRISTHASRSSLTGKLSGRERARQTDCGSDFLVHSVELGDVPSDVPSGNSLASAGWSATWVPRSRYVFVLTGELSRHRRARSIGAGQTPEARRCE